MEADSDQTAQPAHPPDPPATLPLAAPLGAALTPEPAPPPLKSRLRELGVLTLLYTLLAIAVTWPIAQDLNTRLMGGGELGGWLWRYWLMKLELASLWAERLGPVNFFLQMLSLGRFPETGNVADLYLMSWPLDLVFGHPTYYNLKCLLILVLNGLAGYQLSRAFTPSRSLAFAGGAVLSFNSFVSLELYESGLRQAILWWMALAMLGLERVLTQGRRRDAVIGGIMCALTAGFYWFYGLFLGMYGVMRVLVALPAFREETYRRRTLQSLVLLVGVALPIAWLFAWPYIYLKTDHTGELPEVQWNTSFPTLETLQHAPMRPSTLEENLLASLARVLHSSWSLDFLWNPAHPHNVSVIVGLLAIGIGVMRVRREWFWLTLALFFWLHTGGPYLQEAATGQNRTFVMMGGNPVTLPYALTFKYVPMMSRLFAPYRSAGMLWLLLTILLVRNSEAIRSSLLRIRGAVVVFAALVVGLHLGQGFYDTRLATLLNDGTRPSAGRGLPVASSVVKVHPFYTLLAEEEGKVGVIELPLNIQQDLVNYYQVIHQKKLFRGWAVPGVLPMPLRYRQSSEKPETQRLLWLTDPDTFFPNTFGEALMRLSQSPYVLGDYDPADVMSLAERGFKYVILHERGCYLLLPERGDALYAALKRRLGKHLGEGTEFVELMSPTDPESGRVPSGVLGEWVSSALPGQASSLTRFHMTVFRMPEPPQPEVTPTPAPAAPPTPTPNILQPWNTQP